MNLLPFDGLFTPLKKEGICSKSKLIMTLAGGPVASLILVVGLLLLKHGGVSFLSEVLASSAVESFVTVALSVNLSILLLSVAPMHYFLGETKGMETDGLQMIRALRGDEKEKPQRR